MKTLTEEIHERVATKLKYDKSEFALNATTVELGTEDVGIFGYQTELVIKVNTTVTFGDDTTLSTQITIPYSEVELAVDTALSKAVRQKF